MLPALIPGDVRRTVEVVAVDAGCREVRRCRVRHRRRRGLLQAPRRCRSTARRSSARRHAGAGPERDVLRLSAEHHQEPAVRIELHDHVRSGVDDPDVVLRIDAHLLGEVDAVDALADLLDELAGLIELKQARAAVIEGPLVAERRDRVAGARVDEDMALRVGRHAGDFAERRQAQDVGVRVVVDLGHRLRERARTPSGQRRRPPADGQRRSGVFMAASYLLRVEVRVCCGRRRIFCTRNAVISATYSSFGFRQSI